ncbi:MAG: GAF domain-containing protein [Cyanobacteria bacterium J06639_16]
MAGINLKKLVKKLVLQKEASLIQDVVKAIDPDATIQTAEGSLLFNGTVRHHSHRYPIALDGQILGWVNGNENSRAIATLLSQLIHRELEKRTLAQELLSKYKEISLLFNLSEKIIDSLDVQEVASLVLEEARQLLNSGNGALLLLHDKTALLESIATFGNDGLFQQTIPIGQGVIGNIVQVGRGEIVNDVRSDPRNPIGNGHITSLICAPLKNKGTTIGAIALSHPRKRAYSTEDLKLLTTLACQAAGVIKALLHERQLKESRQNDLILRLSSQIRDSLELDAILETAVSEIYTVLHLDRCCFLWYQTTARQHQQNNDGMDACSLPHLLGGFDIVTESKRSNLSSLIGFYPPEIVGGLARRFCQYDLVRIDDVQKNRDAATRQFLQSHQFAAFLAIPIQNRSGQIGVICCGTSQEPRTWSDSEVALLQAVTNQLAIALDQAELYDHSRKAAQLARDKAQQLEATVVELQQTQLHLVQSEKMSSIGQMVAGVAHEINNPVSFIHGNLRHVQNYTEDLIDLIQRYQQEYDKPSETLQETIADVDLDFLLQDLPKTLKSMAVGTERIREIVLSLRNFSRLDQADSKTVDIHEGIDSTLLILSHRLKPSDNFTGVEIVKAYGDLPPVECYPGQLNQVFMNILANGIDALEESGVRRQTLEVDRQALGIRSTQPSFSYAPTITIRTQHINPNRIRICITDNGPGVPPAVQAKLFDPFFTTKGVGKGTGLGLSISYQIITEHHGGTLSCQSEPWQGTQFVIEIPIRQGDREDSPLTGKPNGREGMMISSPT